MKTAETTRAQGRRGNHQPARQGLRVAHDPRVVRALSAMRAHLDNAWTLERLAKIAGASRAAFVRLFVAETGMAPMACLRELRLARAAELLVSPSDELGALPLGLDELAARVGYGNAFALSRAFKRRLGLAPTHYRDRILGLEGVRRAARLPITSARAA